MRTFILDRKSDITGISGTGIIAYGVEWLPDGPCDLFWLGTNTTGQYPDILSIKAIHCYNDNAKVVWLETNHFVAGSQKECPDCRMPDCICVDDDVERLRSLTGLSAYEQGKVWGCAHALVDSEMVAEHSRMAADVLNLGPSGTLREQFMEGYGYGFSEKKEVQEKIIKAMEDHPFKTN